MKPQTITKAPRGSRLFVIPGDPTPKPRQTRSDKWNTRPPVLRYRAWADLARLCAPPELAERETLNPEHESARGVALGAIFYIAIPKSRPKHAKDRLRGQRHLGKPDIGNLMKALEDALFPEDDSAVWKYINEPRKLWDDGDGPRTVVTIEIS